MNTLQLWTMGHSVLALGDFLERLRAHRIELVADVRRYPVSRRQPQFERRALESALAEAGIRYRHFPGLGGRREPRPDSRNGAWRNEGFRGFADHMDTAEFRDAAEALAGEARRERTVILCSEGDWKRCHRGLLSDWFRDRGATVHHIEGDGSLREHPGMTAGKTRETLPLFEGERV